MLWLSGGTASYLPCTEHIWCGQNWKSWLCSWVCRSVKRSVQISYTVYNLKFGLSHYFGYWLLQQLVLPYKPWCCVTLQCEVSNFLAAYRSSFSVSYGMKPLLCHHMHSTCLTSELESTVLNLVNKLLQLRNTIW